MGAFSAPLSWTGWFRGQNALARARYLDSMRMAGRQLTLTLSELRYKVVIKKFTATFERTYQIPYAITLEVVQDEAQPLTELVEKTSVDSLIDYDAIAAADLVAALQKMEEIRAGEVTTTTMSGAFGSLQSAINSVSSFATATQSQLASVLQPLAAFRSQVGTLMASVNNTLANVTTVGGLLPNNPVSQQVSRLNAQLSATQQYPLLLNLDRIAGRMAVNAQASYKTDKTVTQAGGNLFTLAAQEYGDPLAWTALAKANALSDPQLTGVNTLTVPPAPTKPDGVLEY
jgi:nucleoid-associated protein YgaU